MLLNFFIGLLNCEFAFGLLGFKTQLLIIIQRICEAVIVAPLIRYNWFAYMNTIKQPKGCWALEEFCFIMARTKTHSPRHVWNRQYISDHSFFRTLLNITVGCAIQELKNRILLSRSWSSKKVVVFPFCSFLKSVYAEPYTPTSDEILNRPLNF